MKWSRQGGRVLMGATHDDQEGDGATDMKVGGVNDGTVKGNGIE